MQPIVLLASLFLGSSAVSAQAPSLEPAAEQQIAAAASAVTPGVYTSTICITATTFYTVTPTHGKLLCPECATDDQNITQLIDLIKHVLKIIPALLGLTSSGFSLDIVQNILNALTEAINAFKSFVTMPIISCLTIAQAALVLLDVTSFFGVMREACNWVVFLGTVLSKIPILNTQLVVFVRDFVSAATLVVNNLDKAFKKSGGCFNCSGVAIVNNEISQIQSDVRLFNQQFGANIGVVPLFTACDDQVMSSIYSLCTTSVLTIDPPTPTHATPSSTPSATPAPPAPSASAAPSSPGNSGSVLPTAFSDSSSSAPSKAVSSAPSSEKPASKAVSVSVSVSVSTSITSMTVVDTYTTYVTSPGVVTLGNHTYTVSSPTTITVTDCPCTIPIPKTHPAAQVETTCDWTTVTTVVSSFTTYCPEPTTFCHADVCHTVTAPTTITVTNCPCTIPTALPVVSGSVVTLPSSTPVAAAPVPTAAPAPAPAPAPAAGAAASSSVSVPAAAPQVQAPAVSHPVAAAPVGSGVAVANAASVAKPFAIAASLFGAVMLLI